MKTRKEKLNEFKSKYGYKLNYYYLSTHTTVKYKPSTKNILYTKTKSNGTNISLNFLLYYYSVSGLFEPALFIWSIILIALKLS